MLKKGPKFALFFRVIAFSVVGIMALVLAVSFVITNDHDSVFDMLLASVPILAMLIFGSQLDLVRIWLCRRGDYAPASVQDGDEETSDLSHHNFVSNPRFDQP